MFRLSIRQKRSVSEPNRMKKSTTSRSETASTIQAIPERRGTRSRGGVTARPRYRPQPWSALKCQRKQIPRRVCHSGGETNLAEGREKETLKETRVREEQITVEPV